MAQKSPQSSNTTYIKLTSLSGLLAGGIGRLICHPIDTVKAKLYIQRTQPKIVPYQEARQLISHTWAKEGIRGFYRGITINVLGAAPAYSLYLTTYELTKLGLQQQNIFTASPFLTYITAGLVAEAISCSLFLPIDVIKERMQVQHNLQAYQYKGSLNAIFTIITTEGTKGLYRAYGATLGSFGPYSALYFLAYENLKSELLLNTFYSTQNVSPLIQNTLHSFKALLLPQPRSSSYLSPYNQLYSQASLLTNPLFISKFRMQVQYVKGIHQESEPAKFGYRNQLHGIYTIYQQEGFKALYRGYSARLVYGGSLSTVSMAANEVFRNYFHNKY